MATSGGNRYALLLTAASTSAQKIIAEQPNLKALCIQNPDAAITLYFGLTNAVTSSSYLFSLAPGKAISDKARTELWVIAGSGTPAIGGFWED
jgi:hypothetical protein